MSNFYNRRIDPRKYKEEFLLLHIKQETVAGMNKQISYYSKKVYGSIYSTDNINVDQVSRADGSNFRISIVNPDWNLTIDDKVVGNNTVYRITNIANNSFTKSETILTCQAEGLIDDFPEIKSYLELNKDNFEFNKKMAQFYPTRSEVSGVLTNYYTKTEADKINETTKELISGNTEKINEILVDNTSARLREAELDKKVDSFKSLLDTNSGDDLNNIAELVADFSSSKELLKSKQETLPDTDKFKLIKVNKGKVSYQDLPPIPEVDLSPINAKLELKADKDNVYDKTQTLSTALIESKIESKTLELLESNRATFKGDKGDVGEQGLQGVKGEKGDRGETGGQGLKGDKGDKGDRGLQGIQGVAGARGANGSNGTNGFNIEQEKIPSSRVTINKKWVRVNRFDKNKLRNAFICQLVLWISGRPQSFDIPYYLWPENNREYYLGNRNHHLPNNKQFLTNFIGKWIVDGGHINFEMKAEYLEIGSSAPTTEFHSWVPVYVDFYIVRKVG